MPPKRSSKCEHPKLIFSPSSHASAVGYKRPSASQRIAATTSQVIRKPAASKNHKIGEDENESTFPAPLVLPEDELAWDPSYPVQSLRSWIRHKSRNKVTPERHTIYFTGPPDIEPGLEFLQEWTQPRLKSRAKEKATNSPETKDVLDYLEAFYHGVTVKMLPSPNLCFTTDVDDEAGKSPPKSKAKEKSSKDSVPKSQTLWLNTNTSSGCIGIRARATPKGDFSHQLNLNDLLDAAIEILPDDAYALLMLVKHDIYEDDDDDFACGRAYGGSRIAVVSGARYNPSLDAAQRIERDHAWPASHCEKYMRGCCEAAEDEDDEDRRMEGVEIIAAGDLTSLNDQAISPMQAALAAHMDLLSLDRAPSISALYGLWLSRVCRTASHELGHCFGIDHCVYYACAMQGTASVIEDARQPPYLCPVDLAKVLRATGADENERYRALLKFCEKFKEAHLFAAYGAWIQERLEQEESA
jgi:archaemetzincin